MPDSEDQACSVIGKFTQNSKADGKRQTKTLVMDQGANYTLRNGTEQLQGHTMGNKYKLKSVWIFLFRSVPLNIIISVDNYTLQNGTEQGLVRTNVRLFSFQNN